MVHLSEPSNYARLLQNQNWLNDLTGICEWAKTYKGDSEIKAAFAYITQYYGEILKYRGTPDVLAANQPRTVLFAHALLKISLFGEEYDSTLANSTRPLLAAMLDALPNLKTQLLDINTGSGLRIKPRSPQSLS